MLVMFKTLKNKLLGLKTSSLQRTCGGANQQRTTIGKECNTGFLVGTNQGFKMSRIHINSLVKRQMHTNAEIVQNCKEIRNRNPRNLERLRIARKPIGYVLERDYKAYWHRLLITRSQRYVSAGIHHFENGLVISASSKEWGLKKQLYSTTDITAYKSVGSLLAQRCLECGIVEIFFDADAPSGDKARALTNELTENGISLSEPNRYQHPNSTFRYRPEKPWESYE